ncbi:MAG: DUF2142 domain-containing protein [Chloroflexi bacterium]|nr:DUF2142 domain-containing protein [Chloroflexota bacterium]
MREKIFLSGIIAAFIALGACYSFTTPLFEAPDEVWHYAYVREIALRRGFPVMQAGVEQAWAHEGTQAPLYYLLGAPLIAWIDPRELDTLPAPNPFVRLGEPAAATNDNRNAFLHTPDENFPWRGTALAAHLLRLYSVALGALTLALTFALAREVFPAARAVAFLAAIFVACLPQFLFIGSSINNDNLATLLSAATLWQLARTLRRGIAPQRALILGALAGGALLTKFNTITLVPLTLLVIASAAAPKRAWRVALVSASVFVFVVASIAGWWYARNLALYGDLSGLALIIQMIGERPAPMDLARWFIAETEGLRFSTWGVFGWMSVLAAPAFYAFFDLLALAGVVGMCVVSLRAAQRRSNPQSAIGDCFVARNAPRNDTLPALLALWCAITFAAVVYYNRALPAAQGRLLFPALAAFAVLWACGILALVPARAQTGAIVLLGALQFGVAAFTPTRFIAPAYAPTVVNMIPSDATRVNARFADGAQVLAARISRAETQPGDVFDVTIYSRISDGQTARRAIFVHIVNSADVIVAQRDSAIASGNWNALAYPALIADSLRVPIPILVSAPDDWRVIIGTYDLESRERLGDPITIARLPARANAAAWQFDFDGRATLLRAEIAPQVVASGGTGRVILRWSAAPPQHRVFIHALGDADRIWAEADAALAREMELVLRFAPETPLGIYPLELGVYPEGGARVPVFDAHNQLIGDRLFLQPIRVAGE